MAAAKQQLKKYTQAETAKKLFAEINRSKRNSRRNLLAPRWPFFHPILPILHYPILSYPILSFPLPSFLFPSLPDPFIVPGSTPYPVPSPVLGPVSPWSPFLSSSERHFFDLIPVLTPFCTPLIARRFEVNRFFTKKQFLKKGTFKAIFLRYFRGIRTSTPAPPEKWQSGQTPRKNGRFFTFLKPYALFLCVFHSTMSYIILWKQCNLF